MCDENIVFGNDLFSSFHNRILKRGVVIPLIFPKVPQSSLGILRVPQLPPPLEPPPLKNPTIPDRQKTQCLFVRFVYLGRGSGNLQ